MCSKFVIHLRFKSQHKWGRSMDMVLLTSKIITAGGEIQKFCRFLLKSYNTFADPTKILTQNSS